MRSEVRGVRRGKTVRARQSSRPRKAMSAGPGPPAVPRPITAQPARVSDFTCVSTLAGVGPNDVVVDVFSPAHRGLAEQFDAHRVRASMR